MCRSNTDKTTEQSKPHETLRNRWILELVTVSSVYRPLPPPAPQYGDHFEKQQRKYVTYVRTDIIKKRNQTETIGIFQNDFITNLRLHIQTSVRGHCLQTCCSCSFFFAFIGVWQETTQWITATVWCGLWTNQQLQRSAEEVTFSQSAFWDLQGLTWMTSMRQESFSWPPISAVHRELGMSAITTLQRCSLSLRLQLSPSFSGNYNKPS